jgi:type I restriction enzyme S subunit
MKTRQEPNGEDGRPLVLDPYELPNGWAMVRVAEGGSVQLGRQRSPKDHQGTHMRPYLRVANVFEDRIDTSDVMEMNFTPREFETYRLERGDILLNEGQSLELVGRPAMYRDEVPGACFQNTLVRFQAGPALRPAFALLIFRYYLHGGIFQRIATRTVNIAHLSAGRFADLDLPLPPLPEQDRIVAQAEMLFTRLDAGVSALKSARARLKRYRAAVLEAAVTGELAGEGSIPVPMPLGELVEGLGQGWSPNCEPERPPNDDEWSIIKTTAVQPMCYLGHESKALPANLAPRPEIEIKAGDMLVTRKGRGGRAGVTCHVRSTRRYNMLCDTVYRFRCRADTVKPEYLEIAMNAPSVLGQLYYMKTGNVNSGVNLTQARLLEIMVPVPPITIQERIVNAVDRCLSLAGSTEQSVLADIKRADRLRQSILKHAFEGKLVPQDPADEPASVVLERIRRDRKEGSDLPEQRGGTVQSDSSASKLIQRDLFSRDAR